MNNANSHALKTRIVDAVTGYVTVKSGAWTFAFAAVNPKGYINVKVKLEGFERFVTFGYLDVKEWEIRSTRFCEVRDPDKVESAKRTAKCMFAGSIGFEDAPNPRGKPPGSGGRKSSGGYRRSAPRTEAPTEAPRTEAPPTGDVAAMVQAIQDERDMLANKLHVMERELDDLEKELNHSNVMCKSLRFQVESLERTLAQARANMRAERPVDGDTVIIDGKAAKIWRLAVGEYGEGNMEAAANMLHKVMVMVS